METFRFRVFILKRHDLTNKGGKLAISTVAIAVIVLVIVVIAGVGAYVALSASKTTSTTTTSTSSTTPTTSTSSSVSSSSTTITSSSSTSTASSVCTTATSTVGTTVTGGTTLTTSLPTVTVNEAGSSLLYPLWEAWKTNITAAYPNVLLNVAAGGSGAGQAGVEDGTLQIGASDAYLLSTSQAVYPCILDIPVAVSAQQINYNLPGLSPDVHLNFSGNVLAGIYNDTITTWNNPAIVALQTNTTVRAYLNATTQTIIPIHRQDSSGDTFIFTQYLSDTSPSWNSTTTPGAPGYGLTVSWPANPAGVAATGNSGMVAACNTTSYSIAYIGVSYLREATIDNPTPLGYAYLQNQAGNFVNISTTNIAYAAANVTTPNNEVVSLVYAPGADSYPIVNYEYALVANYQTATGMALTLRTILTWTVLLTDGNSPYFLGPVNFVPLPTTTTQLSLNQIAEISGP